MDKDFDQWNKLKKELDSKERILNFKNREIWWAHVGLNIGHEENGKGDTYKRPVLIIRKFSNRLFWGLPLTTQIKDKYYYHKIEFKNRKQCVMLSQFKIFEAKRLTVRMGTIGKIQFKEIKRILSDMMQ